MDKCTLLLEQNKWSWNWEDLCGTQNNTGPLNPNANGLCFQQLYLQVKKIIHILPKENEITTSFFYRCQH